ncbi:MAG: CinA family nicotinamide mononucleotide deamidase-related protein [Elusimicrobiales bacterium]|nr:CinA family nicotinamide mononucleotide deamidase-related protein [Elusimicrobiales bacterium]
MINRVSHANRSGKVQSAPRAFLIFTGTELLRGKLNAYTPLLSAELAQLGIETRGEATLPDDADAVSRAVKNACTDCDIIIVTGGLGPTFDDVSREAAAAALGRELKLSKPLLSALEKRFARMNRAMPPTNARQALLLDGAKSLPNPAGTAPGQICVFTQSGRRKLLALQPGPLGEWRPMFARHIRPALKRHFKTAKRPPCVEIKIGDMSEAAAGEALSPVIKAFPDAEFTILASPGTVRFFASPRGCENPAADAARIKEMCRELLGDKIFGEGHDSLESALGGALKKRGWTLATAESCTGGLISHLITNVPGSSEYFLGGTAAYSNAAKMKILGVKKTTLKKHGAVSAECALEMARGAKKLFGADCAVSTTGIAGPGGGTPQKPVGLVYIAATAPGVKDVVIKHQFGSTREPNKTFAASAALNLIRCHIKIAHS